MEEIELVIKLPRDVFKKTIFYREFRDLNDCITTIKALEKAVPLPKKQGLIDKLLETDKNLSIGKDINGNITVRFEYGYIKDDGVLIGSFGKGETFEEAVIDYCRQISGKTLVFDYPNSKRETFKILILGEGI